MNTPRDKSIGAQMHIASSLLKKRLHIRIHNLGHRITMEQLSVLETLLFRGPLTMGDLAKMAVKENAVITRMVDLLEKRGWVERRNKPGDRRVYIIHLTDSGKHEFETIIPHLKDELVKATSALTRKEYEEGMRIIKKIIKYNTTE